jgi:hypothetical protein
VYDVLRTTLQLGTQSDIFASTTPVHLRMEAWWSQFRQEIREVYSTKTGVGAKHDAAVAKKANAGKKVVGRKEKSKAVGRKQKSSQQSSQTQVAQSSTSLNYISNRSILYNSILENTILYSIINTNLYTVLYTIHYKHSLCKRILDPRTTPNFPKLNSQ